LDEAAKAAADFKEDFLDKPYFTINERLVIPDYTGDKYLTTHACFGRPCKTKDDAFL
jgi:hypothetical protein